MNKNRNTPLFTLFLVIGDICAILGAYSLAYILRVKLSDTPVANFIAAEPYFISLLSLIPFVVVVFALTGTYSGRSQSKPVQVLRVLIGALVAMLLLITIDYFYNQHIFPAKLVPLYGFVFSIGLLGFVRIVLRICRWGWYRRDRNLLGVIIVGDSPTARSVAHVVSRKNSGYKLIGVIGDRRYNFVTHKTFAEATEHQTPDVIVQVATRSQPTLDHDLLVYSIEHYTDLKFIPSDIDDMTSKTRLELFADDIPVLDIEQTSLRGWGRIAKRLFDVTCSTVLLVVLSPLLLLIALLNKLILGKVLFRQVRLTRGNQEFKLFKFQTVRQDLNGLTPEEAFTKIGRPELIKQYRDNGDFLDHDPRYGAWALFLRKTSLDELPQLINVVRGDISLVGPRALIPQELSSYEQKHLILTVKSGVTGLAQISGRRELAWDERRKLDIYYAQNWSFVLDLQILFSTAWQVLTGRGAQ